jgi:membrane fusion protein (multidrug efflux system)
MKPRLLVLILAIAAAIYFLGVRPRQRAAAAAAQLAQLTERPAVRVALARRGTAVRELILPGTLQAFDDTAIHARASGYLGKWLVDIGDSVRAGQPLAVIDSPETDQQLNQARANLAQAKANLELARITAERWRSLGAQNAVARQDVDQKAADYAARRADVTAAEANVQRWAELQRFETVTAPFDGVISARNVDVGALISAGSGPELFHLTQSGTLRAYVNVPQAYVPDIRRGLPVDVLVEEFPGRAFAGQVARFAGALDPASRTLLVEVEIPNPAGRLFAGMFCRFRFELPSGPALLIPSNDAVIRAAGTLVALVTDRNTVHYQPVELGRDFGSQIEVRAGLAEGARLIENPSDALLEGMPVEPVAAPAGGPPRE